MRRSLSDKAVLSIRQGGFSPDIAQLLEGARRYAEGTAVRIEVRKPGDLAAILQLAAVKLAH